jgi:N-carbamoyl-L-amino-acid hydrolase
VAAVAGAALGGGPLPALATGAGHDAGVLATVGIPAAMIFVRNPTGVSHAPDEHVEPADAEAGVRSLAAVLADLCR